VNARPILFVISGPSGSGKGTALEIIRRSCPDIERVTTYTTRSPRENERPGRHYHFVTEADFFRLVSEGEIVEYSTPYGDYFYGSPRSILEIGNKRDSVIELDYRGMLRARSLAERRVVSVFLVTPTLTDLQGRIGRRAREANLADRIGAAREQLQFAWAYDYVLLNDDPKTFESQLLDIVRAEQLRRRGCLLLQRAELSIPPDPRASR